MKRKIEFEDCTVTFDYSEELKDIVFEKVLEWFINMEEFGGCISQKDFYQLEAPEFLSDLAKD